VGGPGLRASAAAVAPVPPLADLPEDIRRTVPKLVVSGSVYSSNPAQRILIVNGQVLNEGATLARLIWCWKALAPKARC
jgi:general secretion pathway protein B